MNKLTLLAFAAEAGVFTSRDLVEGFDLPLNEASGYLTKGHGRGHLQRFKVDRAYSYSLSSAGLRHLRYWVSRAAAEDEPDEADVDLDESDQPDDADLDDDEDFGDDVDDDDDDAPPDLVTLFCPRCRRAFRFTRAEAAAGVRHACGEVMTVLDR